MTINNGDYFSLTSERGSVVQDTGGGYQALTSREEHIRPLTANQLPTNHQHGKFYVY